MASGNVKTTATYPVFEEAIPEPLPARGRYGARFARNQADVEAVQRLRFEVFNLELGEGLEESFATGLDADRFDAVCHHLIVEDLDDGAIVGTYRMQTSEMARSHGGFYTAEEFDLGGFPDEVVASAIEVGRASVAKAFRNRQVLFVLWRGLAAYLTLNRKNYLFGCCSLTSQDPLEGKRVMDHLESSGQVHPEYRVLPQPDWACYADDYDPPPPNQDEEVKLPRLFRTYLRYGAKICGPPAIDRDFKTIDYLVLLNTHDLDEQTRGIFFR